jgi:hypothetical protein
MTKSQMEIMGLVVIVVLIAIGFFFYIAFKINNPPPLTARKFSNEQLATNFVATLLRTNTRCQGFTVEELLKDCVRGQNINCPGSSCLEAERVISNILDKTLKNWSVSYNFEISRVGISYNNLNCTPEREKDMPGYFVLPIDTYGSNIELSLEICK